MNNTDNHLSQVLIRKNVLSPIFLDELIRYCDSMNKTDLSVFDPEKSNETGETHWRVDKNVRDTQHIDLGPWFPSMHQMLWSTVHNIVNPFYNCTVKDSEVPQILSYGCGGHYGPHIDAEALWTAPNGEVIWKKSVDRDLSFIFYLNDGYEGGDLILPDLGIRIRPERGMMVAFPSNRFFKHGVEPVRSGHRYSMVCWATVHGQETLEQQNLRLGQQYGCVINN